MGATLSGFYNKSYFIKNVLTIITPNASRFKHQLLQQLRS